jgi:hypothetical protein
VPQMRGHKRGNYSRWRVPRDGWIRTCFLDRRFNYVGFELTRFDGTTCSGVLDCCHRTATVAVVGLLLATLPRRWQCKRCHQCHREQAGYECLVHAAILTKQCRMLLWRTAQRIVILVTSEISAEIAGRVRLRCICLTNSLVEPRRFVPVHLQSTRPLPCASTANPHAFRIPASKVEPKRSLLRSVALRLVL